MTRKYLTISVIVLLCAIIVAAFLYFYRHQKYSDSNPALALPMETALVLNIAHPAEFHSQLTNSDYQQELSNFALYQAFDKAVRHLDSAAVFQKEVPGLLARRPMALAWVNDSLPGWLLATQLNNRTEQAALKRLLKQGPPFLPDREDKRIYHSEAGQLLPQESFLALKEPYVLISPSRSLLLLSLQALDRKNGLLMHNNFTHWQSSDKRPRSASLWLNFEQLTQLSQDAIRHPVFDFFGTWTELDLNLRNNSLMMNGFSGGKGDSLLLHLFRHIEPQRPELPAILPAETRFMMAYSLGSGSRFRDNFRALMAARPADKKREEQLQAFKRSHQQEFDAHVFSYIQEEATLAYVQSDKTTAYQALLVFNTVGQARSLELLEGLSRPNSPAAEPVQWLQIDSQTRYPVYRTPEADCFSAYWQPILPETPVRYFSFYRNYLVFADDPAVLEHFFYANLLQRTLATHPYFNSFAENFSYRENLFLFAEPGHILPLAQKVLNPAVFHSTTEQNKALSNFYGLGLQFSSAADLVYTSLFTQHTPHRDKEPRTIWQSRLDSSLTMKPALVDNHNNNEKEILVQDAGNTLYLLNNKGRILWKRNLEGPILSEVYQIDYYRNNKLQYLFNTADRIYLLDRNGNHVARYPLNLSAKATNGLAVFDYDNNKDYRIFVALDDRQVHLFDKTGNSVTGWNRPQTEGAVTTPVQHFVSQGRDYLVFSDTYRSYILDRRGDIRVRPDRTFVRNPDSPFFLQGEDSDRAALVSTTELGQLATIALPSGQTVLQDIEGLRGKHSLALVDAASPRPRYLLTTENQLRLIDQEHKSLFNVTFENKIQPLADVYRFSASDTKFGVVEQEGGKIHLINSDGSHYQGFPLKGTSRFSIGFLKSSAYRFNLITGGPYNYLYNYRVE
ncbi:DUF3352 domain-containing protein [Geofilum rhodophaeum]|uniref:DUF3352 domain-containing protein n=1 Tax=Geofilum rhodophaeum TaxID=1965019 RepID=UPI000B526D61|nr:DUF3352 domain-containing protein [Geofilum rhodophaeum]